MKSRKEETIEDQPHFLAVAVSIISCLPVEKISFYFQSRIDRIA
jgi:hypothetical protein